MGFFTDAYDLFIIGVVIFLLTPLWHLNALEISLLGSTALLAAALGSLVFGHLADLLGRKVIYGYELLVLAAAISVAGFLLTFVLPEPDRKSLETIQREGEKLDEELGEKAGEGNVSGSVGSA